MEKLTLIDTSGTDKDSLRVQRTETREIKSEITASQIKQTISYLQLKKARLIAEIDAEILMNQNQLSAIENLTKDVVITKVVE